MKILLIEKLPRILYNREKLEKELKIKITNRGKEVSISGKPEDEYIAEKVIDALEFGFSFSDAMLIKKEDFSFEILSIKDYTKRSDLKRVKARIIGKGGKTLKVLSKLTFCEFELKDNLVGIIGDPEKIENAQNAIISLIQGSKQSNVYARLEKLKPEPIADLGLKK